MDTADVSGDGLHERLIGRPDANVKVHPDQMFGVLAPEITSTIGYDLEGGGCRFIGMIDDLSTWKDLGRGEFEEVLRH